MKIRPVLIILALAALLLSASCGGSGRSTHPVASPTPTSSSDDIARTLEWLTQQSAGADSRTVEITTWINPPPSRADDATAQVRGCPILTDRLPILTDQPFMTEFTVAGVTLPNPVPASIPALKLVIPYRLGNVDVPAHARLRGRLLDPDYGDCGDAKRLFVLDSIVTSLPGDRMTATPGTADMRSWQNWSDATVGFGLHYPNGWKVDERRNVGAVVEADFETPAGQTAVRLAVTGGTTYWSGETGSPPPVPLAGDRRQPVNAGPAAARLVDAVGDDTTGGRNREVRVVFNYNEDTVVLSTRFVDGAALDSRLLDAFSGMVASLHFDHPLAITDPQDPTLTARATVGPGPFIGEATARTTAIAVSGLKNATADDARLVSERDAREATAGSCRAFPERPTAVWLVRVNGVLPTGLDATRIIYLDAMTGENVCQAPAPASATPTAGG